MNLKKIANCDKHGAVYLGDREVFRAIPKDHVESVTEVVNKLNNKIDGIVKTTISNDKEINAELNNRDGITLLHHRVSPISYPHEWCGLMLKDSSLFHIELSISLYENNLYLKDAHPWNILFEKGRPVFVDYTSIVNESDLLNEEFLTANNKMNKKDPNKQASKCVNEIHHRMFKPYFFNPLIAYITQDPLNVRKYIENTTLNSSTHILDMRHLIPRRIGKSIFKKVFRLAKYYISEFVINRKFKLKKNYPEFLNKMKKLILSMPIETGSSAYSSYYSSKGEDQDCIYSNEWNQKQKSVYNAINKNSINSVLDVACNTGWYAMMAEKINKSVIAFDIDEGSIEELYKIIKDRNLNILPLVMNFTEMTKNRFSIYDGNPVILSAESRFKSDSVIALGIIHHLVLGLGMSLKEVIESLDALCEKQLVIEFVELEDPMIQNEPSFFKAFFKDESISNNYKMEELMSLLEDFGYSVIIEKSYPSTRKILVCEKAGT